MDFPQALQSYFGAERALGLLLAVLGLAALAFAVHVGRNHSGAFMWGVLIPLTLLGLGSTGGGLALAQRSAGQLQELSALYEKDPKAVTAIEIPRMEKVNNNWPRIKLVWASLALIALGLIFGVRRDGSTGVALVLLMAVGFLMSVDVFAEKRAMVYTAELERLPR